MSDPNLKLNSLARYSKQSPRVVLEEYSSCEVPAGCGGVVLRWQNAKPPIPMHVRSYSGNGKHGPLLLDGMDTKSSSRIPVSYGKHVLARTITGCDPAFSIVLITAHLHENYVRVLQPEGDTTILSVPDGTWRYTLEPPEGEAWQQPDFDDSVWKPMVEKPFGPKNEHYIEPWTENLTSRGARGLGIDTNVSLTQAIKPLPEEGAALLTVFIRKTFAVWKSSRLK